MMIHAALILRENIVYNLLEVSNIVLEFPFQCGQERGGHAQLT